MREVLRRLLPAEGTSPLALGIFFPIGVLLIVLAAPVTLDASGVSVPLWWLVAVAVQGAFSAIVLAARARGWVAGPIIFAAGFVRGIVPPLCAPALLGIDVAIADVLLAGLTSGVACLLWLGVIGNVLRARADYRREYADLARQAAQMRALSDNDVAGLDPAMLQEWAAVRQRLQRTSDRIRRALDEGRLDSSDMVNTARVIQTTVDEEIRPLSHRLWLESPPEPPSLGARWILTESLRPWRPPILVILMVTAPLLLLGAIRAAGLDVALTVTALIGVAIVVWLGASSVLALLLPRHQLAIGIAASALMPVVLAAVSIGVGEGLLQLPANDAGAIVIAIISTAIALSVIIVRRILLERQLLLDALSRSIDADAVRLMAAWLHEQSARTRWGEHLHQSVQSELSAVATMLHVASSDPDALQRSAAIEDAAQRVMRIARTEPALPLGEHPADAIRRAVQSWAGLVTIEVHLDDCTADQLAPWEMAALAVPEALANSVRRGGARWVSVSVRETAAALEVEVIDDGHLDPAAAPGVGSAWLDRHVPGRWSRERVGERTILRMSIPSA